MGMNLTSSRVVPRVIAQPIGSSFNSKPGLPGHDLLDQRLVVFVGDHRKSPAEFSPSSGFVKPRTWRRIQWRHKP